MFVTHGMSPREFDYQFKERAEKNMGERVYRISLARAQAMVAAAVEANERNKIALPKEYAEARHLVERWVLHPPVAALAADTTRDELAHLPLTIDHQAQPLLVRMEDLEKPEVQQWLAQHQVPPPPAPPSSEDQTMTPEEQAQVEDILRRTEYPKPVAQLLTRGEPKLNEWENYRALGIEPAHIPDLIRMATDPELHHAPTLSDVVWAPRSRLACAWRTARSAGDRTATRVATLY